MKWIIARHNNNLDGTMLFQMDGSTEAVKEYLVEMVKQDRENDKDSTWIGGTESTEEVKEKSFKTLYAYGSYYDYHIDYTAKPIDLISKL